MTSNKGTRTNLKSTFKVRGPISTPGRAKKKSLRMTAAFGKHFDPRTPVFQCWRKSERSMLQKKSPFLRVLRSFHLAANIEIRGGEGRPCGLRFAQGTFFLHDPDPHPSEKSSTRCVAKPKFELRGPTWQKVVLDLTEPIF